MEVALMDTGLLVARLVLGPLMAAHGAQKLFGWFGGYGLSGVASWLESIGFKPGRLFALAAGLSEFAGGVLLTAGLLGPVGPALVVATMIVAAGSVHWPNVFATQNGIELPLTYGAGAVALALAGPGQYSVDQWLGLTGPWSAPAVWTVLVVGIVGGVVTLAFRHPQPEVTA
jgi:putative oxidoreductase